MSAKVLPSSDASRQKPGPGILTPTSDISLNKPNHGDIPVQLGKGRPSGSSLAMEDLLKPTIVVRPNPSSLLVKPRILHPLMLLPREHLPLSCLDLSAPAGDFPSSRFFESKIKMLELEGRLGSNLLLAQSETTHTTYAIERQESGLYVLCKLGSWVELSKLGQLATVVCRQRVRQSSTGVVHTHSAFPPTTSQLHKESRTKRRAIEEIQSMVRKRPKAQPPAPQDLPETNQEWKNTDVNLESRSAPSQNGQQTATVPSAAPEPQLQVTASPEVYGDPVQPMAEDIFQNIRTQYFEALYHSMGSLAYFAKGPLSRARAAFHLDCDSNLEMRDLIDFLKSLAMTTVLIDKKYREAIPQIMSKMKTHVESSEDNELKLKKRKTKERLGKDGLYTSEDEHVRRWWIARMPDSSGGNETISQEETKYHLSSLRTRETQLQMIIILEILALEPVTRPAENSEDSQLPGMESQPPLKDASLEVPAKKKKKNKHNLPVLLDVHADRLCIWQSTMLDEVKALAESQTMGLGYSQNGGKANSDPLKDFCVDIILPFFSSRLPDMCDSINRKLGGPVIKSPPKPLKATNPPKPKLGSTTRKPVACRKERTLERVLSDERMKRGVSRGPSGALALMRSASATTIPGLKREGSEPLLTNIPLGGMGPTRPNGRFSRSQSQSSLCSAEDQKARKKAMVEAELQEAISALKKPNRALAGKAVVEAAEQRTSGGISQLKKAKKPSRVTALQAVQVKATPANNRFKDALAGESQKTYTQLHLPLPRIAEDADLVPSSSSMIPSTATRRAVKNVFSTSPCVTSTPLTAKIQTTPARAAPRGVTSLQLPPRVELSVPPSSPLQARRCTAAPTATTRGLLAVPGGAAREYGADSVSPSSSGFGTLFETPIKQRTSALGPTPLRNETPVRPRPASDEQHAKLEREQSSVEPVGGVPSGSSIYQQLGWDDDDDIDDLA